MLPHFTPSVPNAALSAMPPAQHLNTYPTMIPGSSAVQGTRGHTRRRGSPRVRQTGCPCTFRLWQPVFLNSATPHKLSPKNTPASRPPKGMPTAETGCVLASSGSSAHRCGQFVSGRMSSASIGPPGSWPCRPSTPRLSRLPQPPSRRIAPLESFAPEGADSMLLLGARLARGGAPAKEGRGSFP